jgi:hypothetical protein
VYAHSGADQEIEVPMGKMKVQYFSNYYMPYLNVGTIRQKIGEEDEEVFTSFEGVTCMQIDYSSAYAYPYANTFDMETLIENCVVNVEIPTENGS